MKLVKSAFLAVAFLALTQGVAFSQAFTPSTAADSARISAAAQPKYAFSDTRAIGVGLIIMGAAYGIGGLTRSAVESMARQPESAANIQAAMILSAALIEGVTLLALIIVMLFTTPY